MRRRIENKTFDAERSLYNLVDGDVVGCSFGGPADGESVLKEARDVVVRDCDFHLRYPLWHANRFTLAHSTMDEGTRAPLWYTADGKLDDCDIRGVKCLRECDRTEIVNCRIVSPEFGWKCRGVRVADTEITAEYLFLECRDMELERLRMHGKYSFQYVENVVIRNSDLDTKDAFWHAKNVTVINSTIKGEYLAWFSDGLTLINCRISGTQPLCYCRNLRLENCTMEDADLAFEYSDVEATVLGHIDSVKNPRSGSITAGSIGELIRDDTLEEVRGLPDPGLRCLVTENGRAAGNKDAF